MLTSTSTNFTFTVAKAITTATILGSQPRHHGPTKPPKAATVAFVRPQRLGAIRFRLAATPSPTPMVVAAAPATPAPVAVRPAPPAPAPPRPPAPPISAVGGAAGVEFSLVNQDRAASPIFRAWLFMQLCQIIDAQPVAWGAIWAETWRAEPAIRTSNVADAARAI